MNNQIKIYHIVHIGNLPSIIEDGYLFSDAEMRKRPQNSVLIGMNGIKERRLTLSLTSHSCLHVGECVPFYFCPRITDVIYDLHGKFTLYRIQWRAGADCTLGRGLEKDGLLGRCKLSPMGFHKFQCWVILF